MEKEKMKMNIILPAIGRSGGMDVIYQYVRLFQKMGHDVVVYRPICGIHLNRYSNPMKEELHRIYCSAKAIKESKKRHDCDSFVWKIADQTVRDADVLIATAWPTAYLAAKLSHTKGRKYYIIQDYEVWDNSEKGKESYKLPMNKIVISTWINNRLKEDLGMGPFPVVYDGLDIKHFQPGQPRQINNQMEIRCLMLNHPMAKKGIEQGLEAFKLAKAKCGNLTLTMFGTCKKDNLPVGIHYVENPTQEELLRLYQQSDIFLFPSLEEGWGLTPLEAMACGCAVVGTRTGFVLDLGKHEENMMISEPGDVNTMAENIIRVLTDIQLRKKLSEMARETAEKLSWDKSARQLLSCLQKGEEE